MISFYFFCSVFLWLEFTAPSVDSRVFASGAFVGRTIIVDAVPADAVPEDLLEKGAVLFVRSGYDLIVVEFIRWNILSAYTGFIEGAFQTEPAVSANSFDAGKPGFFIFLWHSDLLFILPFLVPSSSVYEKIL